MTVKLDRALVLEFSSFVQVLKPDEEAMTLWINTMASGDYRFGFGLLRSADDEYDPLGVLAALQGVDWTWDEQDEAWAYKGSAVTLNPLMFGRWIGARDTDIHWLTRFVEALAGLTDRSADFTPICEALRTAMADAAKVRSRLDEAQYLAADRGVIGPHDGVVRDTIKRRYDRTPFYATDWS